MDYTREQLEAQGLDAGLISQILLMQDRAKKGDSLEAEANSFLAKIKDDTATKKVLREVFDKHGIKVDLPISPLETELESVKSELGKTREEINNDKLIKTMHEEMSNHNIPRGEFNKIIEWAKERGFASAPISSVVEAYALQRPEELPVTPNMGFRYNQEGEIPTMDAARNNTLAEIRQLKTGTRRG